MKIDPLKCDLRCLECKGGSAEAVYKCEDPYCPRYALKVSDRRLRDENPTFDTARPGCEIDFPNPAVTDGNYHPLYTARGIYNTEKGHKTK